MLRSALRAILVLTLCLAVGGQWLALQSVAWASMLVHYSHQTSLAVAVEATFNGNHPCGLCKGIDSAQHSQKKSDAQPVSMKHDLICATRTITFLPRSAGVSFPRLSICNIRRVDSPPIPPPRSELA